MVALDHMKAQYGGSGVPPEDPLWTWFSQTKDT